MPSTPPIIDVSAALIFRDGRLLIAQRPPGGHLAGFWEFPGGKREPGESWESCLIRECREELDVDLEVDRLYQEIRHDYPEKSVRLRFFLGRLTGPRDPTPLGCAQVQWINRDQLGDFEFPPADAELLNRLRVDAPLWARSKAPS